MTRAVALNALKAGITRLRPKGGADPDALYDLVNGYVTLAGTIESRPGTVQDAVLPAGTKGLCAFNGGLVVFAISAKTMPAGYTCEIVVHPTAPATALREIHSAGPFLGFLYVVAEFADGAVFHYWLQTWGTWTASKVYSLNAVVTPTAANGYGYKATRNSGPAVPWAPNVTRAVGDRVAPTVYNGYEYVVDSVVGTKPASGATEPVWPVVDGAAVTEETDGRASIVPPTPTPPDGTGLSETLDTRYRDLAGRKLDSLR